MAPVGAASGSGGRHRQGQINNRTLMCATECERLGWAKTTGRRLTTSSSVTPYRGQSMPVRASGTPTTVFVRLAQGKLVHSIKIKIQVTRVVLPASADGGARRRTTPG